MATTKLKNPKRTHPARTRWLEDEARLRASYVATRRLLAPFLVTHRFEGTQEPVDLKRAQYGYGIALNRSYLDEIMGHIRSTDVTYKFGPLEEGEPDQDGTPSAGLARQLFSDATKTGVPLRQFMEGEVLEWMLSSLGGFLCIDTPEGRGEITKADEEYTGKRPYFRFVPWSAVEDLDTQRGRWIKLAECVDNRMPDGDKEKGNDEHHVLYELLDDDTVSVSRFNKDGQLVNRDGTRSGAAPINLGKVLSVEGDPILPVIPVKRGVHPEIPFVGAGLLLALADIVIDLFNVVSEMREGYRDATFGLLVHKGPDGDQVQSQLQSGSRLVRLGDVDNTSLERLAADGSEVASGITLIELGVKNWALSAKRQAAEAMQNAGAEATSGVSLQAEFQLDLKPLLVSICGDLDAIQTNALFIAAQLAGLSNVQADELGIDRSTDFRLEDEASRIARIAKDYALALPLTAEMKVQLAMAWLRSANVIDLNEDAEPEAPTAPPIESDPAAQKPEDDPSQDTPATETVGKRIERQLRELAESQQSSVVAMNLAPKIDPTGDFPPLGSGGSKAA